MAEHAKYKLVGRIIELSEADNWEDAHREWRLREMFKVKTPRSCLCGHAPITNICLLENQYNRKTAIVGNHCVTKFLGMPSNTMFQAISRVEEDNKRSLNTETLDLAWGENWISEADYQFYSSIQKKRKLTAKQIKWKQDINNRVLRQTRRY